MNYQRCLGYKSYNRVQYYAMLGRGLSVIPESTDRDQVINDFQCYDDYEARYSVNHQTHAFVTR